MDKRKKRRTEIDIGKREKQKDYTDKRTEDRERFLDDIVEKKSKYKNVNAEVQKENKDHSSYQKKIQKHMKKNESMNYSSMNNEDSDFSESYANSSVEYSNDNSSEYNLESCSASSYNITSSYDRNNITEIPKDTESTAVKGRAVEQRKLDIGERQHVGNFTDKRIHENQRFQNSVTVKKSKLIHGNENAKRTSSGSGAGSQFRSSPENADSLKKRRKKQKQIEKFSESGNNQNFDTKGNGFSRENSNLENSFKGISESEFLNYDEKTEENISSFDHKKSKNKEMLRKKAVYDNIKNSKPVKEKLTTEDIFKDKMVNEAVSSGKKSTNTENLSENARRVYQKKESRLIQKRKRASKLYENPKFEKTSKVVKGAKSGSYLASEYMRTGSDENTAVEATDKGLLITGNVAGSVQNKIQRKRKNPLKDEMKFSLKHRKNAADPQFATELEKLKKTENYNKKSAFKKHLKRKQMKRKIYEEHDIGTTFRERAKKEAEKIIKGGSEVIRRNIKGLLAGVAAFVMAFVIIGQLATFFMGGISAVTSQVLSTSYLSDENILKDINGSFTDMEYRLADELANLSKYHPGYDEYVLKGDTDVGHDIHELLSYITARYGGAESAQALNSELKYLFNEMYRVDYKTVVETRYRTVCSGGDCHKESYEWRILKVTVNKKSLDEVARAEFKGYPDNLAHYETLLKTGGNMEEYFGGGGETPVVPEDKIIGDVADNPDMSAKEKAIVEAAYRTPSPGRGYCAKWVSNVYLKAGFKRPGGNACDQYYRFCKSNDLSKLRPGMIIAVPSHPHTKAGKIYGHVGIYMGNGIVRENIGYVKDTNLKNWIKFYGSSAKWGYAF